MGQVSIYWRRQKLKLTVSNITRYKYITFSAALFSCKLAKKRNRGWFVEFRQLHDKKGRVGQIFEWEVTISTETTK